MFQYYEDIGFWGNSKVLGWLLGPPAELAEAFAQQAREERELTAHRMLAPSLMVRCDRTASNSKFACRVKEIL